MHRSAVEPMFSRQGDTKSVMRSMLELLAEFFYARVARVHHVV